MEGNAKRFLSPQHEHKKCPRCGVTESTTRKYCMRCGISYDSTAFKNSDPTKYTVSWQRPVENRTLPPYASWGARAAAYAFDGILGAIVWYGFMALPGGKELFAREMWGCVAAGMILSLFYHSVLESSPCQGTIGKMAVGIRVCDLNGNRISFMTAVGRYMGRTLSWLILGFGYIMCLFTPRKQCLHDLIFQTIVVGNDDL